MNPFLRQPFALQRTPLRAERPESKGDGSGVVSLRLYDPLDSWGGPWGLSAKEFVAALDELDDDTTEIRLLINSPGGEVWEGLAILNALRAHPATVVAVVEGIAASSASFLAAGVDELHVMANAELFIHNAWGMCLGNAAEMQKMAADLTHEDRNIASIYAAKTGGSVDDWLAAMADERWYSAEEAVEAGLADRIVEPKSGDGAPNARARFDLSALSRKPIETPAASAAGRSTTERTGIVPFLDDVRQRLGVAAEADEATVLAALDETLAEQVENETETAETPELPEGVVAVEAATLAELRAAAELGRAAHARQQADDRTGLVEAAVADGRIAPARREAWLAQLAADPGAAATLASLEKGLIPVGAPIGSAGGAEASVSDELYASVFGKEG